MGISLKVKIIAGTLVSVFVLLVLMMQLQEYDSVEQSGEPLFLYCAAGIKFPVEAAVRRYELEYDIQVRIQYGGSGTLLSNLAISKIGDLYLAGDYSFIEIARDRNLVEESIPLAGQYPVLAVARGNPKNIRSIRDLLRDDVRVSLGNPEAASIGKQTRLLVREYGDWEALNAAIRDRGVFKPTVNEVANDIKIGAVDAGIIWNSTVFQYKTLESIDIPGAESLNLHVTIGVLTSCKRPAEALRFARYLAAPDRGLEEFDRFGFDPVDGDEWVETPEILFLSGALNRTAVEKTIIQFEKREGARINRVYNGCGILVGQMKAGERPDAYLACDISFMTQVGDIFHDAVDISETDIVLAVRKDNPLDIRSLADLTEDGLKVGIANSKQSALGALTETLLETEGLLEPVMKNVKSMTPTADLLVNQLRTSSLDVVIVYEANTAHVRQHIHVIEIDSPYARAVQPFAIGRYSKQKHITGRFLKALMSRESRNQYDKLGFHFLAGNPGGKLGQ